MAQHAARSAHYENTFTGNLRDLLRLYGVDKGNPVSFEISVRITIPDATGLSYDFVVFQDVSLYDLYSNSALTIPAEGEIGTGDRKFHISEIRFEKEQFFHEATLIGTGEIELPCISRVKLFAERAGIFGEFARGKFICLYTGRISVRTNFAISQALDYGTLPTVNASEKLSTLSRSRLRLAILSLLGIVIVAFSTLFVRRYLRRKAV